MANAEAKGARMRLLAQDECSEAARKAGLHPQAVASMRAPMEGARNTAIFPYRSRLKSAEAVARALVAALQPFEWAVLWAFGLPWGDRSMEEFPPDDWSRYAAWRRASGDRRPLHQAPGHLFEEGEEAAVAEAVALAIYAGWDAALFSVPLRCLIRLSHDDFIECQSFRRADLISVAATLTALGLMPTAEFNDRSDPDIVIAGP